MQQKSWIFSENAHGRQASNIPFQGGDAIVCDFQLQAELLLIDLATLVIKVLESDDI